ADGAAPHVAVMPGLAGRRAAGTSALLDRCPVRFTMTRLRCLTGDEVGGVRRNRRTWARWSVSRPGRRGRTARHRQLVAPAGGVRSGPARVAGGGGTRQAAAGGRSGPCRET